MTFEVTIQTMYDAYPEFFKERADCLNHLFCTLGNGWEWKNGQLVSSDKEYKKFKVRELKTRFVNGKAHQHNLMSLRDVAVSFTLKGFLDRTTENTLDADKIDSIKQVLYEHYAKEGYADDKYYEKPRNERWYFAIANDWYAEYVPLFNIPKNIKPDWLAGIEECKAMIREDGFDVDLPCLPPVFSTL
jgi:hypothetical protein